jgi:hypothetical protein
VKEKPSSPPIDVSLLVGNLKSLDEIREQEELLKGLVDAPIPRVYPGELDPPHDSSPPEKYISPTRRPRPDVTSLPPAGSPSLSRISPTQQRTHHYYHTPDLIFGSSPSAQPHRSPQPPLSPGKHSDSGSRADKLASLQETFSNVPYRDPWGKPGAGAPMRDDSGKILADRQSWASNVSAVNGSANSVSPPMHAVGSPYSHYIGGNAGNASSPGQLGQPPALPSITNSLSWQQEEAERRRLLQRQQQNDLRQQMEERQQFLARQKAEREDYERREEARIGRERREMEEHYLRERERKSYMQGGGGGGGGDISHEPSLSPPSGLTHSQKSGRNSSAQRRPVQVRRTKE